jgi:phosphopantothenoylcysteine decarboxylase/phosphopantothenate--cysteine ligase
MTTLPAKRLLLGVTGGIAAYKSAELARRLREAGAEVRVVMTRAATEFITPLTMQAVSGNPVHLHLLDSSAESAMSHIDLARWADAVLIAPASADFLARLAHGRADDLLSTLCLATAAPLAVAPAMNQQMWRNAATQANVETLRSRNIAVWGPAEGEQACGDVGPGRMLEPADLVARAAGLLETGALAGLHVLVTAGPTQEALDPVRYISNRSSGKMGYAVAQAALDAGARVTLITGPTALTPPSRAQVLHVTTAQAMYDAVHAHAPHADIFIGVAAVADYRPAEVATQKIKKSADNLTVVLHKNPDILASIGAFSPRPYTVGFAAETGDVERLAREKLLAKGADLIAANEVGANLGFDADDNALLLVDRQGTLSLPVQPKPRLARQLIQAIAERYHATRHSAQNPRRAHR